MFGDPTFDEYADCKRCGKPFEKRTWNNDYCPDCRIPHRNERMLERRHSSGQNTRRYNKTGPAWSDFHRFKFYMEKTWMNAICPECGQHMSVCQCSASDPGLRQCQAAGAETWAIWSDQDMKQYLTKGQ